MFPTNANAAKFLPRTFSRIALLMALAVVGALALISPTSASLTTTPRSSNAKPVAKAERNSRAKATQAATDTFPFANQFAKNGPFLSTFALPQASAESIATYAADCTTPKVVFALGDTVCAVTTGVPIDSTRSVTWRDPASFVVQRTDLTTSPNDSLLLPTNPTSFVEGFTVNNRGTWRVDVVPFGRSLVRTTAFFTVKDPANPASDMNVYNSADTPDGNVPAGTNLMVETSVTNFGPDDAANVVFTEEVPANATFVSETQTGGPAFTCTNPNAGDAGTSNCTLASLASGGNAEFVFVYQISGGVPKGTLINSLAQVSSDTGELHTEDNQWTARAIVTDNPNALTCFVGCPANMTVTASSSSGKVVNFTDDIEVSGTCGTVTASPASGSLFPIGTTTVNVSSSEGGGSCSFTITVVDTPAPTITCAADQTAQATGAQTEVPVTVNTPTATGTGVVITGVRNDNRPIDDPYPVGTTTITWTAKECTDPPDCADPFARSASCTQHIIVTNPNAPTITCPGDKTFDAGGDCQKTLTASDIGTPTTGGPDVTVTAMRSDQLNLTDPYPGGQTFITWTATNALGSVSCTQTITITTSGDTTPPTLTIPPDVNATTSSCTALLDDELGVATATDNCSAASITRTGVPLVPCPIPGNPTRMCESFLFPVGTTNVTYTATDAAGNTATGVQHVTVHEPTPPTFTFVPANVTVFTGPGATSCGAVVADAALGTATIADNCDTTVIRSGVPAGNIFPVGQTIITYTAKADLSVSATQTVTVVDNTPPVVTAPAAVTLFTGPGATSCGVTVSNLDATFGVGSATDNCPGVGAVTRSGVPAGNVFPLGQTTVTYSATDAHGNTSSATQIVTVVDNTPPTISCQANIIADFDPVVNGAVVTYTTPVGTDNCSATTTQTAGLASGSTFPVGTTTNTFRVTDGAGNFAECSFKVTVALTSLIGLDSVSITGSAVVDSYDSTGVYPATKSSLANVLSNGTITLGGSGKVFGNVRSTRAGVVLTGTTQVTGNATAGTTVSKGASAIVGGTITNNALAPVMVLPAVPSCGPPYSPNTGITGTFTYNASTGDLTLSGNNIATLANGTYCFHSVSLSNSAQLKVNGPVVIRLTGTLTTTGATSLPNTTMIPSNMQILSSYTGSNGVTFGNGSNLHLVVYAPNTGVTITGAAPVFGTVVGKTITISNSGMIHYDTQLKAIWPDIWTLIFGP